MKGISLFSKYILFILGFISLMPGMAYSQTFKHYEGFANKKGDYNWNRTQKCHELTYYYYVTKEQNKLHQQYSEQDLPEGKQHKVLYHYQRDRVDSPP